MFSIADYLLHSYLYQTIIFGLLSSVVIWGIILFWQNKKHFNALFNISRNTKVVLIIILFAFSLLISIFGLSFSSSVVSDDEWELLVSAKNFLEGNLIIHQLKYGILYPLLLAIGFLIFGTHCVVASVMNFIFGVLSIVLVFAITQLMFKNEKVSLITTSIYTFTPLVFMFTGYWIGFPMMLSFFLLLFTLTSLLFFKYHKVSLLILSLLLFVLISQIKPEYFILIVPFILCFLIYREYKAIAFKKLFLIGLVLFVLLTPYFIRNVIFKEAYSQTFCGNISQITENQIVYFPLSKYIDPTLKTLVNNRFSLNYLLGDIPNFTKFWTSKSLRFVFPFILVGILIGFINHRKETFFVVLSSLSLSLLYLADCACLETRYIFPIYPLLVTFSGYGLFFIIRMIKKSTLKRFNVVIERILVITFLVLLFSYWYINNYRSNIFSIVFNNYTVIDNQRIYTNNERIKLDLANIPKENSYIFVPHPVEQDIIRFLDYDSTAIINAEEFQRFDDIDFDTAQLHLQNGRNNYFIETWYCDTFSVPICQFIKEKYSLSLIKQVGEDSIYLINTN